MSTCILSKRAVDKGKLERGALVCLCILESCHCKHDLVHLPISANIRGQTKREAISFLVALILGCESECNAQKSETKGRWHLWARSPCGSVTNNRLVSIV